MTNFHLAQINIGRLNAPIDSPQLAGFVAKLDEINALADDAPGFVWRLQTEDGNATAIRPYDDHEMAINMSVWESIDALAEFVYRSGHVEVMRQRRQWFEKMDNFMCLWWIPAGSIPTVDDAKERLALLERLGPTAESFTFKLPFPPPGVDAPIAGSPDLWDCPA